ncbi:unnamed protein product [Ascophyllum nodosum]
MALSRYRRTVEAAIVVQSSVRGAMAAARYRRAISAIICTQTWWRGEAALARYRQKKGAVLTIQARWRGSMAVTRYRRSVDAAVVIQARVRGAIAKWETNAAIAIQRRLRAAEAEAAASTAIGAWWRSVRGVDRFRRARKGVLALQSTYRGGRARREWAARSLALRRRCSAHKAATRIQAIARGTAARRTAGRRIVVARCRIVEAAERARADPSQILGVKVKDALWDLEHSTRLTAIVRACIVLELTSRYSKVCCQVMAESRCPEVMYDLVHGLNRSPPHQKILVYILKTFINIAQRGDGLPQLIAAPPTATATLMNLLQMYRERQEIFLPTLRLVQQLAAAHQPTKDECNESKYLQRLESLQKILTRKVAAEAKSEGMARARIGAGRSARSLKAVNLLLKELSKESDR